MHMYNVVEGDTVYHWVIEMSPETAVALVKNIAGDGMEADTELVANEEPLNKVLTVDLDGIVIKHTCEEWLAIYNHEPKYLACSEY